MQKAFSNIFARKSENFVKLHFGGDSVVYTPEHPFFVNNTWREAKNLKAGDSLFVYSGYKIALDSIFAFRTDTAVAVYNLEASGNHLTNRCETKISHLIKRSKKEKRRLIK